MFGPFEYGRVEMDKANKNSLDSAVETLKAGMDSFYKTHIPCKLQILYTTSK